MKDMASNKSISVFDNSSEEVELLAPRRSFLEYLRDAQDNYGLTFEQAKQAFECDYNAEVEIALIQARAQLALKLLDGELELNRTTLD